MKSSIPARGTEARSELSKRAFELTKLGLSQHNIAVRLSIPFGSVSRLIREHKEKENGN